MAQYLLYVIFLQYIVGLLLHVPNKCYVVQIFRFASILLSAP